MIFFVFQEKTLNAFRFKFTFSRFEFFFQVKFISIVKRKANSTIEQ